MTVTPQRHAIHFIIMPEELFVHLYSEYLKNIIRIEYTLDTLMIY